MGVWKIDVELVDGTVVKDLFTNGLGIYRLIGWDTAGFSGQRGAVPFGIADIKDIRQPWAGRGSWTASSCIA